MGLALNVLLLLLSSTATLAAFGGKTWQDGSEPLARRITRRGWLSLLCLLLAFCVGVVRELRADASSDVLKAERDQAKKNLDTANAKLDGVTSQLNQTRAQLRKQTNINLITSFARGTSIKEGSWWLEMAAPAGTAKNMVDYLVSEIPAAYSEVAIVHLYFSPFMGINSRMSLRPGLEGGTLIDDGRGTVLSYPPGKFAGSPSPELILPAGLARDPFMRFRSDREGPRPSQAILHQRVGRGEGQRSAAIAFRDLTRRREVASISLEFRKEFATEADRKAFYRKHPDLKRIRGWLTDRGTEVEFAIPAGLQQKVQAYWKSTVKSASSNLYLDGDGHLMLENDLEMGPVKTADTSVKVSFFNTGDPEITVGIEEF